MKNLTLIRPHLYLLRRVLVAAAFVFSAFPAASLAAQTAGVAQAPTPSTTASKPKPALAPPASEPAYPRGITSANLLDRTYGPAWPKPSFPSSEREKKQFTVEYVYRYVQSDYTPPVELPTVTKAQAQGDTPEHTLTALISALKTLDYDWWLSLWDAKSQELFREEARSKKQDAAYWRPIWQSTFVGRPVTLASRLETVTDITLEFRIGAQQQGRPTTLFPAVFRFESGHWMLTRELGDSTFLPWMGRPVLSVNLDTIPVPEYTGRPVDPTALKSQSLLYNGLSRGQSSTTDFVW